MGIKTIQIEHDLPVAPVPRSDVAIIFCPQPNIRPHHKLLIRQGLGLGRKDEEYVPIPVLGGGAVLAYPEHFIVELSYIRTSLEIMSGHFGIFRFVVIGHENCLRMGNYHRQTHGDYTFNSALRDMITIHRMYRDRCRSSQCPVRKMFAELEIDLSVIFMKFPRKGEKLKYVVID
jgi:hypothetical protein